MPLRGLNLSLLLSLNGLRPLGSFEALPLRPFGKSCHFLPILDFKKSKSKTLQVFKKSAIFWGFGNFIPYYPSQKIFIFCEKTRTPIEFSLNFAIQNFVFFTLKLTGLSPLSFRKKVAFRLLLFHFFLKNWEFFQIFFFTPFGRAVNLRYRKKKFYGNAIAFSLFRSRSSIFFRLIAFRMANPDGLPRSI